MESVLFTLVWSFHFTVLKGLNFVKNNNKRMIIEFLRGSNAELELVVLIFIRTSLEYGSYKEKRNSRVLDS